MWVDSKKPFRLVYALCKHEYLGYLIEPHVVQLNQDNSYSLTYQRIFNTTANEFASQLDPEDYKLINLLESIEQSILIKRFHKKHVRPAQFFSSIFNDTLFQVMRPAIDRVLIQALALISGKPFFLMSKEGWPVSQALHIALEPCSVLFHFRRNAEELRYFPTLKYQGTRLEFMYQQAEMVCDSPACMLMDGVIYQFQDNLDGRKLVPFLNKRYISIPRSAEASYLKRFVLPLIEKYSVYAEGFGIRTLKLKGTPVLRLKSSGNSGRRIFMEYVYGAYTFMHRADERVSVKMEYDAPKDLYTFYRVRRAQDWERTCEAWLCAHGLEALQSLFLEFKVIASEEDAHPTYREIDWLNTHLDLLKEAGFQIVQEGELQVFALGQMQLEMDVLEENDWFDIRAMVHFGEFEIPFIALREHILNHQREFELPNGETALIPEAWFAQYTTLFHFSTNKSKLQLKKQHIGLLEDLCDGSLGMREKLQGLNTFNGVEPAPLPIHFKGVLRPYQKAGYDWFMFLNTFHLGGCLADDMGLGKTIQTLALLQQQKEQAQPGDKRTSLVIVPTSLVYNWQMESLKFTPALKILNYTGGNRVRHPEHFTGYDIVLTTYGTLRVDVQILQDFHFHYMILDESQNIKNVSSKSFKAIQSLHARHKLILSGTPVENTVADLWPQMSFINPGLLGSHSFFVKHFVLPIEKKKDEQAAQKLQALIKPFILRRTKQQVAQELPDKSEKVMYCEMTEAQGQYYEETKAEFRNLILEQSEQGTIKKSAIQLLQGLSKLRQLANHPKMIDAAYQGDSGKFQAVIERLDKILLGGHKVLIFSQFVRQMKIYSAYFDEIDLPYAYLDGSTSNRQEVVNNFRHNAEIQVFLISIKAGGVGLNLTEADYVFILDPWWNPAVEMQAIDRSHRIGQTKNVFIYKFITKNTVEEKILALQKRKKDIAESLIRVEESFMKSLTEKDIEALVE